MATAIKRISDGKIIIECSEEELQEIINGLTWSLHMADTAAEDQKLTKLINEVSLTPGEDF